ncbi:hypothetical protein TTHERM_002653509, partial (macronuclear) [Tetrahymena thermophila SB210]
EGKNKINLINNQLNQQRKKKNQASTIKRKQKRNQINQKSFYVLNQFLQLKILQSKIKNCFYQVQVLIAKNEEKNIKQQKMNNKQFKIEIKIKLKQRKFLYKQKSMNKCENFYYKNYFLKQIQSQNKKNFQYFYLNILQINNENLMRLK